MLSGGELSSVFSVEMFSFAGFDDDFMTGRSVFSQPASVIIMEIADNNAKIFFKM